MNEGLPLELIGPLDERRKAEQKSRIGISCAVIQSISCLREQAITCRLEPS
ncbi:MAG: hypothetical protein JWQ73_2469 [Variovorax sp.]|nr:hypothetical protein [Variovorax sp.]